MSHRRRHQRSDAVAARDPAKEKADEKKPAGLTACGLNPILGEIGGDREHYSEPLGRRPLYCPDTSYSIREYDAGTGGSQRFAACAQAAQYTVACDAVPAFSRPAGTAGSIH